MTEFKSPLGNHTFSTGPAPRVLTVDDPTQQPGVHPAYAQEQPQPYNRRVLPSEQNEKVMQNLQRELTLEEREELQRQRQAKESTVPKGVKERIAYLTGIGRIRDSVKVEDENGREVEFSLQSLKDGELEEISEFMNYLSQRDISEAKKTLELRRQILARSLWAIDGIKVGDLINSSEVNDKVSLIRNLDENLVALLQSFYEQKIMNKGRKTYTIKSEEDLEALNENLKK